MAGSILDQIVETKRQEIETAKTARPVQSLVDQLESAPPVRNFLGALAAHGPIKLIAEVKKASPSAGCSMLPAAWSHLPECPDR